MVPSSATSRSYAAIGSSSKLSTCAEDGCEECQTTWRVLWISWPGNNSGYQTAWSQVQPVSDDCLSCWYQAKSGPVWVWWSFGLLVIPTWYQAGPGLVAEWGMYLQLDAIDTRLLRSALLFLVWSHGCLRWGPGQSVRWARSPISEIWLNRLGLRDMLLPGWENHAWRQRDACLKRPVIHFAEVTSMVSFL